MGLNVFSKTYHLLRILLRVHLREISKHLLYTEYINW